MNEGLFTGFPVPGTVARNAYPNNVVPAESSGGFYGPLVGPSLLFGTVAPGADVLVAIPFITIIGGAVTSLAFFNTSAAENGTGIRTGIYTDNVGLPNSLVAEASVTTLTAAAALREPTITATLDPNTKYWFAYVSNNTATLKSYNSTTAVNYAYVHGTAFGNFAFRNGLNPSAGSVLSRSFSYAALPSTWGTPTAANQDTAIISWKKT